MSKKQALSDILARLDGVPAEERAAILSDILSADGAPDPAQLGADLAAHLEAQITAGENVSADHLDILDAIADAAEKTLATREANEERAQAITARLAGLTRPAAEEKAETPAAAEESDEDAGDVVAEAEKIVAEAPEPAGAGAALAVQSKPSVPLGRSNSAAKASDEVAAVGFSEKFELVAASDVPGYATGQSLPDLTEFGKAWEARMMPVVTGGRSTRVGVARIKRTAPEEFTIFGKHDAEEKLENATNERLLPGGSLTAAGGWCAPNERLYDLCPIRMTREGMISVPSVVARRGGIEYQADFDWSAIWSSVGFYLTEAEVIAGTEKPCLEIPCAPDPIECRMDVSGVCLRTNILSERGWPERIRQFTEGALLIHAHKMNALKLARMEELSTAITIPGPPAPDLGAAIVDPHGPGAVESLLSILELQVQYQRYRDRLSQNATLELVAPYWVRGILKSDLRKKLGIDNRYAVTDADVDRYLRSVGVNPQFVYDWQDAYGDSDPDGFGGDTPPTVWPTQVKFLLYPAGTFFQLTADVISLDGVYDHASLVKNQYTSLFTEEGWQLCTRCGTSYVITVDLCANGLSGSHQSVTCAAPTP